MNKIYYKNNFFKRFLSNSLIRFFYPKIDLIICQSSDMQNDLIKNYQINYNKSIVINNPFTLSNVKHIKINKESKKIKFLTVGRLSREKGIDRILKILSKLNYEFEYDIIGDGPLKKKTEIMVDKLGLSNKVKIFKNKKMSMNFYLKYDLFLQGSYVEGFPNAVLESCCSGTPVISFNILGGTKEIINKNTGFIACSDREYINYLVNKEFLNIDRLKCSRLTLKRFNYQSILNKYENEFLKL